MIKFYMRESTPSDIPRKINSAFRYNVNCFHYFSANFITVIQLVLTFLLSCSVFINKSVKICIFRSHFIIFQVFSLIFLRI